MSDGAIQTKAHALRAKLRADEVSILARARGLASRRSRGLGR